jgi:hypothetical protein
VEPSYKPVLLVIHPALPSGYAIAAMREAIPFSANCGFDMSTPG